MYMYLSKTVSSFQGARYVYGVAPPEHFLFLKEADGYVPWCLYKLQSQNWNVKYAAIFTTPPTSYRHNVDMDYKRQRFINNFESYLFDYDISISRDTKQIIGKGVLMKQTRIIDCLAVVKKDTKIGMPMILVSETSDYCNSLIKAAQRGYLEDIQVCKPEELSKFVYRVPSMSPIKVCKILNDCLK